jgi:hypothetical protein
MTPGERRVSPEVKAINKHVAHITTKRLIDMAWNVPGLEAMTLQGFAEFVETGHPGALALVRLVRAMTEHPIPGQLARTAA